MDDTKEGAALLEASGRTYAPHEAVIEASRCLMCDDPPCNRGCPAGVDVRRFVRKIRFGNFRGAARLIRDANPLVGVCGRVCPQEILCMEHCTRANLDTPIDIAGLQRFAGDVELGALAPLPQGIRDRKERVAVIGAGPAGLAAAVALRRSGFQVEVFDREEVPGGVLAHGIPPARLDQSFVEGELAYVSRIGVKLRTGQAAERPAALLKKGFDAVFVATGLWKPFRIGLSGANLEGVHAAADVLKAVARGPRPHLGARVVVIGGGNVAMDAATAAKALGAERVDLCCLESFDEMPAFRSEIEHAQAQGVEFHTRTRPVRVLGRNGRVAGYEGVGIRWKTPGSLAPSNAEDLKGTEFRLLADAVIEAIGQGPLDGFEGLATGERGLVVVEPEAMAASVPGVFAGGDIVSGGATVVQAVAEGKRAAAAIVAYLNGRRAGPDHGAQGERKGGRR